MVDNVSRSRVVPSEGSRTVLRNACTVVFWIAGSRDGRSELWWIEAEISASSPGLEVAIGDRLESQIDFVVMEGRDVVCRKRGQVVSTEFVP